jgi:hypothetical protein
MILFCLTSSCANCQAKGLEYNLFCYAYKFKYVVDILYNLSYEVMISNLVAKYD